LAKQNKVRAGLAVAQSFLVASQRMIAVLGFKQKVLSLHHSNSLFAESYPAGVD